MSGLYTRPGCGVTQFAVESASLSDRPGDFEQYRIGGNNYRQSAEYAHWPGRAAAFWRVSAVVRAAIFCGSGDKLSVSLLALPRQARCLCREKHPAKRGRLASL